MTGETPFGGQCLAQYEGLAEAFRQNFSEHGEIGAAVALIVNGELVAELWGGYRDAAHRQPWSRDTLTNVWSTTKGVTAACFALAVDRSLCGYDDPVVRFWPEFGVAGKSDVTIGELLSHQAGLSAFAEPVALADLGDCPRLALQLAAQAPLWPPGTASGYHALSVGFLASELFRRIEGRTIARFVREEMDSLDIYIGLPPELLGRVAEIVTPPGMSAQDVAVDMSELQRATLSNPLLVPQIANTAVWRSAEIPSANGHATARGLAELYASLIGAPTNSQWRLSQGTLEQATMVRSNGIDLILGIEARWAAGFLRNSMGVYGPSDAAFGHSGWGGSFAFADPDHGLAFAYVMNRMGTELVGEPRALALLEALYGDIAER